MYPSFDLSQSYGYHRATYGTLRLTDASPPQSFTEPLTLAAANGYLLLPELSPTDTDRDATVTAMISAARFQAEIFQGIDLVRKQWDLSFDYWPRSSYAYRCQPLELRGPVSSVDLVRYRDSSGATTDLVEDADFILDAAKKPPILVPAYNTTWPSFAPWPSSAILVRFTSGYAADAPWWSGDSGALVKIGMKMLISGWFNGRIPWAIGAGAASEYPYAVTHCLSAGAGAEARRVL